MTKLSSRTQAVYDAFNRVGLYNEPTFETDRKALAAALRAAADQVVPKRDMPRYVSEATRADWFARDDVRDDLLHLANELEAL